MPETKADVLIEASWEVCNSVGGIYTVLKSKCAQIVRYYSDHNYYVIGPYFASKALGEFEEKLPSEECKKMCEEFKQKGIILHFGKWLIEGQPNAILVDFVNYTHRTNDIKKELWEAFKIDSLRAGNDYNEPIVWGTAVGMLIERLKQILFTDKKVVAQFHEWLAAPAMLYLKKNNADVATVFTTHATVMGRTLAGANVDLYGAVDNGKKIRLELLDINQEAYRHGVESKHMVEKAAAQNADVFTTVSEITAMEAGYILGRKADRLLLNGLDMKKFPTFEEASIEHRVYRSQIREFLLSYFFPYYSFDMKNTLFFFLAGRYEFRDKGIDVFIKALEKLNEKLKQAKSDRTIVAFIWVPANIRNIKPELLSSKTYFNDIRDSLDEIKDDIYKNILYSLVAGKKLTEENMFGKTFLFETKKRVMKLKRKGTPPLSTHDLYDSDDMISKNLLGSGLDNMEDDRVKVIFYPIYLTGADGLLDLNYYQAMQGAHLGVFPSFYEPWGYTPLEAAALGVSSVTTDLAGFGRFIVKRKPKKYPGIFVLKRMNRTDEDIITDLAEFMYRFSRLSKHNRVQNKLEAKRLAGLADWRIFIKNYIDAQNRAIEKKYGA